MNQIASNPPEDYSYPNVTSFDELITRLPTILASSCSYIRNVTPAIGCAGDTISVIGENLFATDVFLKCRFTFFTGGQVLVQGHHQNNTLMHCVVPDKIGTGNPIVEVTTDGVGFTDNGFTFEYVGNCVQRRDDNVTAFAVGPVVEGANNWWPWLFFLLLPLLCCLLLGAWCCRRRKPKEQQQQRAHAVPTHETAAEEDFQIEGLDTTHVPPVSNKWKVQPAAYIGFGKGKMDVNWNGEAPESAPHSLKRQQIPANTLENPVEGHPLTSSGSLAHVPEARQAKKRGCCPWLCCVGEQDAPQYPRTEGEEQHLAVPRVVFHADSGVHSNTTLHESKHDVEG
jgi:hypothetical protein